MKPKKRWMPIQSKKPKVKLSDFKKAEIEKRCQPLLRDLTLNDCFEMIESNPNFHPIG
jgi:hypothetical protein